MGQIQSFYARTAAKLRHTVPPEDEDEEMDVNDQGAEDEKALSDVHNTILMQCTPVHPIVCYGIRLGTKPIMTFRVVVLFISS